MKVCKVEGCNAKHNAFGYCQRHYVQFKKHGEIQINYSEFCSVEGCHNKHSAKGYCDKHYYQFKKHGHIVERTTHTSNKFTIKGNICYIYLYNIKCKHVATTLIDSEDFDKVKNFKWGLDSKGYSKGKVYRKIIKLHRLIMNTPKGMCTDHINHNIMDNRKENLRICTQGENQHNKKKPKDNTSGYKGVSWSKPNDKWRACISFRNKHIHLGHFTSKIKAAKAYDKAAIKYFGEFAYLNFPA